MNVAGLLLRAARQYPDVEAIRFGESVLTYSQLADRSRRLASAFESLGLAPGDRVALLQANGPRLVESLFGSWLAGLTVVPINSRTHVREAAYIIENSNSVATVHGEEYEPELAAALSRDGARRLISLGPEATQLDYEELLGSHQPIASGRDRAAEDIAWLFYTSGTTGRPKGAMLSHRNLRQMALSHLADVRSFQPGEAVLHAAPLTHGSGLVLLASISRGARNVIYHGGSFDGAEVLDLVRSERIASVAFIAPTQIVVLNRVASPEAAELPLESVCYGGGPMFAADLLVALERFGPVFVQIYGQGEAPMTITALGARDHADFAASDDSRIGSAGLPRSDVEIAVVDEDGKQVASGQRGEIAVRGDVVMSGYWDAPDATRAALHDGWLRTGDIGLLDEHGYLFLLDRSKDLIISGGNNIYPREVEEAILAMEAVREVAVIGVPDSYWGESVHALVVTHAGKSLDEAAVIEHCRGVLSSYKKPKSVEFLTSLPVNAYGKVLKRELRQRYETQQGESAPALGGNT